MGHDSPENPSAWPSKGTCIFLGGIVFLTIVLRLFRIDQESAWLDEVLSLGPLRAETFSAYWRHFAATDPNATIAPAYFITQFVWGKVFGTSLIALRLYSVALGTLVVVPLFLIGRRLFNTPAALLTCFLYAVSLSHIAYAQEVRMHMFTTLFALLSFWAFLVAVDEKDSMRWWGLHALCSAIMLWSSPMAGLLYAVQAIIFLRYSPRPVKRILKWGVLQCFFILPYFAWVTMRWESMRNASWMGPPSLNEVLNTLLVFLGGRFSNDNPAPYLPIPVSLELGMALGVLLSLFFLLLVSFKSDSDAPGLHSPYRSISIVLIWLMVPVVMLYLVSVLWSPVFLYRYLMYASFPIYLIVGGAWGSVHCAVRKTVLLAFVLLLVGYQHTVRIEHTFRPNYAAALHHILKVKEPDGTRAPVLVLKEELNGPSLRYLKGWGEVESHFAPGQRHLHDMTLELLEEHQRLWVIMWRWDRMDDYETLLTQHRIISHKVPLGGMPSLYLYRLDVSKR